MSIVFASKLVAATIIIIIIKYSFIFIFLILLHSSDGRRKAFRNFESVEAIALQNDSLFRSAQNAT